jgi:hypothetical protein
VERTVEIPVSLLEKMWQAAQSFAEFSDELEDFLLSCDPDFVSQMRRARERHLRGEARPLADLKKSTAVKSMTN